MQDPIHSTDTLGRHVRNDEKGKRMLGTDLFLILEDAAHQYKKYDESRSFRRKCTQHINIHPAQRRNRGRPPRTEPLLATRAFYRGMLLLDGRLGRAWRQVGDRHS
jgi:hypothetical protein